MLKNDLSHVLIHIINDLRQYAYNLHYRTMIVGGDRMLELVDLSKKFKQVYAVKNLNMFIEKGEIVGSTWAEWGWKVNSYFDAVIVS